MFNHKLRRIFMTQQDPTFDTVNEGNDILRDTSVEEVAARESAEEIAEPTAAGGIAAATPSPRPGIPIPPPVIRRPVSGRYRGRLGGFELELRVDVDRVRPMRKVSGDFYTASGGTTTYFGSFIVDNPAITTTGT